MNNDLHAYTDNVAIIVGLIYLAAAGIMYKWPAKKINGLYGYRTESSMKSQERWDFAQHYATRQMARGGLAVFIAGIIMANLPISILAVTIVGSILILLQCFFMIRFTERALREKFDN